MASRAFDQLAGLGKSRVFLHGCFRPAGTGAVTNVQGAGFTVARTGVGMYTVTLADRWPALLYPDCQLTLATPTNQTGKVIGYTPASGNAKSTIVVAAWDPSANAGAGGGFDPPANAGNVVYFQLLLNNSTITLGG